MDVFVVVKYDYVGFFFRLMWVLCIKEYLYQNEQKPKNHQRYFHDNVTR